MKFIDYSKNWDDIFSMPLEELNHIDLETLDEEDLDALSIRLKNLGENKKVITVFEAMLNSNNENPAVEYTNIFEEVIIHWMSLKQYEKAIELLTAYHRFDETQRKNYRNHFIRRNFAICHIFSGKVDQGRKLLDELIDEAPGNFFNYHDIAFEFYFAGEKKEAIKYLRMGCDYAKKTNNDFWHHYLEERIKFIEEE